MDKGSIKVGDNIAYIRNKDGTRVWGKVAFVYRKGNPKYNLLFSRLLPEEDTAYRLHLPAHFQVMVGHPVVIAHSRVTEKYDEDLKD